MEFDFSLVIENNLLRMGLLAAGLSFFLFFWFFSRVSGRIESRTGLKIFFAAWLTLYTLEYFALGPYSFTSFLFEGNFTFPYLHYLAGLPFGNTFSHALGGGQDTYTMFAGMQYLQLDAILLRFLPVWISLFLHKAIVGAVGFWGSYLLARRFLQDSVLGAASVASIFPFTHVYLLNYSTAFSGPGFAVIPLALYVWIVRSREPSYWPHVLGMAVVLALTDPVHVFPALAVGAVATVILYGPPNWGRVLAAFVPIIVLTVLNWHEVLYALSAGVNYTTRMQHWVMDQPTIVDGLRRVAGFSTTRSPISLVLIVLGIGGLAWARDRFIWRAVFSVAWVGVAFLVAYMFPWDAIGLNTLRGLEHGYMLLAVPAISVPIAARALASIGNVTPERWRPSPAIAVLAAGLALLTWHRILNTSTLVWFGGQSTYFGYEVLNDPTWQPQAPFRAVTLFDSPHPNVTAAMYGIDSFDGQANLTDANWDKYWCAVLRRGESCLNWTRALIDWRYWNGSAYEVDKHIRLDLLAIANVHIIISALPLQSTYLDLVYEPNKGKWSRVRPEFFPGLKEFIFYRLKRIFDPGELFIYKLKDALPRVFAASSVVATASYPVISELHALVTKKAPKRIAVIRDTDAIALGTAGTLSIRDFAKVTDGYDITLEAPHDGGVVVVNNFYSPFWKAWADGRALTIVPANGIHMAIAIPPGARIVKIRYARMMLRDHVKNYFRNYF